MRRIKLVLAALTVMAAMLGVIAGSATAQTIDDCEFVGFDSNGNAIFVCDVDFDGIEDQFDDFIDGDFDGFDDRFFFDNFFFDEDDDGFDDFGGISQSVGQDADSGEVGIGFDVS